MNKKDYIADYINSLLIPYVCIVYTDIEIENIVSFNDRIKDNLDDTIIKTRVIDYIKNITWNLHDLYTFYFSDYKFIDVYKFIIINYDNNTKTFNREKIENKLIAVLNFVMELLREYINEFSDFIEIKKQINWIFKIIPLEIKEKIYQEYYPKSYKKLYDYDIATNIITSTIIEQCSKIHNYKTFNIWKVDLNTKITKHDKEIIKPILDYVKQNPKCVNIEEFKNTVKNQLTYDIKNEKELIKLTKCIKNKNKTESNYKLKKLIDFNIGNLGLKLSWVCYLNSVIYLFIFIPEIQCFISSKDFLNYIKNKNIKYSVFEGLYNCDNNIIANKLQSKYPYKYNFLGFNQIIIQPYIIFIDLLYIITEEINDKCFINLFVFTNKNEKRKIIKHIKNKSFQNNMFKEYTTKYIKQASDYIAFSFDNYMYSIDRNKMYLDNNITRNEYPTKIILNNGNDLYKLKYYIICKDHHYEFMKYKDKNDFIKENDELNNMGKWMIHMLIYKRSKK